MSTPYPTLTVVDANDPPPLEGDALDSMLQALVAAITGLPGAMVRPRWQPTPPIQPEPTVDWCAIGIASSTPDAGPAITYDQVNDVGPYARHETLDLATSFYGPDSMHFVTLLRDGLAVPQNTDLLRANNMAYVDCGTIRAAPELIGTQWIRRQDMNVTLRRKVTRSYTIHHLAIADIHLIDDTGALDDTIIVPPGSTLEP